MNIARFYHVINSCNVNRVYISDEQVELELVDQNTIEPWLEFKP